MNVGTAIGFLFAITVFFGSVALSLKSFSILVDPKSLLIVFGGSTAAILICFPFGKLWALLKVFFRRIFINAKPDYMALVDQIVALSKARRRGKRDFEQAVNQTQNLFLKDCAELISWSDSDIEGSELRDLLETKAETHQSRYIDNAEMFKISSKFPPAFGLMGTTIGMIALLQNLGDENGLDNLGPAMAVALITTLYGLMLANMFLIPISENLIQQANEDAIMRRLVVEGMVLINELRPSKYIEEKMKCFLLPSEKELEKAA